MNGSLVWVVVGCLTLGLAPFAPEPHIIGKVRWVLGGAHGMQPIDWFDLFLHGVPWIALVVVLANRLLGAGSASSEAS